MAGAVCGDGTFLYFLFQMATAGDPAAGRQHRLRRLPPHHLDPGPGRLPAPAAPQPGRPAGVLQRDHRPRRSWPALLIIDLRERHHRPDPALRRRRVLRVHASPSSAWCRYHKRVKETGLEAGLRSINMIERLHHRAGAGRRGGVEVHHQRLGAGRDHPDHRRDRPEGEAPLRPGRAAPWTWASSYRRRRHTAHRRRAGRSVHQATMARADYAQLAVAGPAGWRLSGRVRQRRRPTPHPGPVGALRHPDAAAHRVVAVPGAGRSGDPTYLDELDAEDDNDIITVILPEFVLNQ